MSKILVIILTSLSGIIYSQNDMGKMQKKYYKMCQTDLLELERCAVYPNFPTEELCSIQKCFRGLSYPEINEIIYKRIIELANKNFEKGIILYLIDGKNSIAIADKKNENTKDDNNFIYISVDDFLDIEMISHAKDLYNEQTALLIKK